MSTQVDLSDGKSVRRTWDGRRFKFEVSDGRGDVVILIPTTYEAKELSILFNGDDITGKQEIDK
jgi:hypothetical protein